MRRERGKNINRRKQSIQLHQHHHHPHLLGRASRQCLHTRAFSFVEDSPPQYIQSPPSSISNMASNCNLPPLTWRHSVAQIAPILGPYSVPDSKALLFRACVCPAPNPNRPNLLNFERRQVYRFFRKSSVAG